MPTPLSNCIHFWLFTFLHCFTGAPPFNADTPQEIFERILDCNVDFILDEDGQHVVSEECRNLISSLLQVGRSQCEPASEHRCEVDPDP
jgi:hypothetical protein